MINGNKRLKFLVTTIILDHSSVDIIKNHLFENQKVVKTCAKNEILLRIHLKSQCGKLPKYQCCSLWGFNHSVDQL